jgi:hypothetical protein
LSYSRCVFLYPNEANVLIRNVSSSCASISVGVVVCSCIALSWQNSHRCCSQLVVARWPKIAKSCCSRCPGKPILMVCNSIDARSWWPMSVGASPYHRASQSLRIPCTVHRSGMPTSWYLCGPCTTVRVRCRVTMISGA